ncbi:MAG: type II toxin-antitoxin system VapC family toxin [Myxococcota bacterium]
MDLLLDTHVLLWWDRNDVLLGEAARAAIALPENRVFISAASIWEIAIKIRKGKLNMSGRPSQLIRANGFLPLPIHEEHSELAGLLEWAHPDPFDRMLVVQARADALTLVHADGIIHEYRKVAQLWAGARPP